MMLLLAAIAYGSLPGQLLDLYLPVGKPRAVVVWLHGGGWHSGDKKDISKPLLATLREHHYAVAAVNFRQAPDVLVPESLKDVELALQFVRKYNPRVALMGGSSGGYLAAQVALTSKKPPFAVIDKCGPSDLTPGKKSWVQLLTIRRAFGSRDLRPLSPVTVARRGAPPFLLFHGQQDSLVPASQSVALAKRLTELGVENRLVLVEHAGHEFGPAGGAPSLREPAINRMIAEFLDAH